MKDYKCYLFDVDNTLVVKKPHTVERIFHYINNKGISCDIDAIKKAYAESEIWIGEQVMDEQKNNYQMPDKQFIGNIIDIYRKYLDVETEKCSEFADIIFKSKSTDYELSRNVRYLLETLKRENKLLGIVSNNKPGIKEVLNNRGILEYFDCIIISEEVGMYKPDPAIIRYAVNTMNVINDEVIYVGDHPFDILCSRLAGIDIAWYQPTRIYDKLPIYIDEPNYEITDMLELLGEHICTRPYQ